MLTVLRARRIVTPAGERPGEVVIDGEKIAMIRAIGPTEDTGHPVATVEISDDCVLLPGLVDSHVHINEPGRTEWEGFATATAAAAAGGVTTIVDMPLNCLPPTVDTEALAVKRVAARHQLAVDVGCWGGAVPGNLQQLRPLHEAGVVGFKCFLLPSGVPEFPPLTQPELIAAMREVASFDGLLAVHAEDQAVIDSAPNAIGRRYADFLASRPPNAETSAISMLVAAVRSTGCRAHVVHVSAARSLPIIAAAKAEGLPVTAEVCPHYLTMTADQIPDGATQFKCCPPIRDAANQAELWEGLVSGIVDCVVSDHSPAPAAVKRLDTGDFGQAWGGISSLQLSLPATWTAARQRGITLVKLAEWMAAAPASLVSLSDRGTIAPGNQADFCVFAPEDEFTVDPTALRHRNIVTPYAGARMRGVVRQTWLRGAPVTADSTRGRLVSREDG